MSTARTRLAARAAAAGYPASLLTEIAVATLPAYTPGDTLSDTQIEHVAHAVETLVEAGHDADRAHALLAHHQQHDAGQWRDALWRDALQAANARAQATAPAGA